MDLSIYDDEVLQIIDDIEQNRMIDPNRILEVSYDLSKLCLEKGYDEIYAYSKFNEAFCCYILNQADEAYRLYLESIPLLKETDQWELVARSYSTLGILCNSQGNIPMSMDYYLQGLEVSRNYQLLQMQAYICCNIGTLYLGFHDVNSAIQYLLDSWDIVNKIKEENGDFEPVMSLNEVAVICLNLSNCYYKSEKQDLAQKYLDYAFELEKQSPNVAQETGLYMLQAQVFGATGKTEQLKELIHHIDEEAMTYEVVLDAYDDFLQYAEFLLENDYINEFWNIVMHMDELIRQTNSVFLIRRITKLKIQYYKKTAQQKEYLLSTGFFYELSVKMEEEQEENYRHTLSTRLSLEEEKRNRKQIETKAEYLRIRSEVDALTKLHNRMKIMEIAQNEFERSLQNQEEFGIEILDVDFFKQYNDNYGHQGGDDILVEVANCLKSMERHAGVFAGRYGGDEFILVYGGLKKEVVNSYLAEIKSVMEEKHIIHEYSPVSDLLTLSQGCYVGIPKEGQNHMDFLHFADEALYEVKRRNKNGYLVIDTPMGENHE